MATQKSTTTIIANSTTTTRVAGAPVVDVEATPPVPKGTSAYFHGTPSKDALRNFIAGTASGFA
jgi:hypothetical protein